MRSNGEITRKVIISMIAISVAGCSVDSKDSTQRQLVCQLFNAVPPAAHTEFKDLDMLQRVFKPRVLSPRNRATGEPTDILGGGNLSSILKIGERFEEPLRKLFPLGTRGIVIEAFEFENVELTEANYYHIWEPRTINADALTDLLKTAEYTSREVNGFVYFAKNGENESDGIAIVSNRIHVGNLRRAGLPVSKPPAKAFDLTKIPAVVEQISKSTCSVTIDLRDAFVGRITIDVCNSSETELLTFTAASYSKNRDAQQLYNTLSRENNPMQTVSIHGDTVFIKARQAIEVSE